MSYPDKYYSIEAFNSASMIFKADEVFGFGDFIEFQEADDCDIFLYAYSDYYVEVRCTDAGEQIKSIVAISVSTAFEKYIPSFNIDEELTEILG